jgi:hypothetical protein
MSDDGGLSLEGVADQVTFLSQAISEIVFWMSEAEKSGAVPTGLLKRAHDLAHLDRVLARISALQEALSLSEGYEDRDTLRLLLQESLTAMEQKADSLRRNLA